MYPASNSSYRLPVTGRMVAQPTIETIFYTRADIARERLDREAGRRRRSADVDIRLIHSASVDARVSEGAHGTVVDVTSAQLVALWRFADVVANSVVLDVKDGQLRGAPVPSLNVVDKLVGPALVPNYGLYRSVASGIDGLLAPEGVRDALYDACVDFVLQHELAHVRLGHLPALQDLGDQSGISEPEQAERFDLERLIRVIEFDADSAAVAAITRVPHMGDRPADAVRALPLPVDARMAFALLGMLFTILVWRLYKEDAHVDGRPPQVPVARAWALLKTLEAGISASDGAAKALAERATSIALGFVARSAVQVTPLRRLTDLADAGVSNRVTRDHRRLVGELAEYEPLLRRYSRV